MASDFEYSPVAVDHAQNPRNVGALDSCDGHARITRKPTVCLVGPEGFANAVPAMMEALGERSPIIFVTGSSTLKRQGAGGFKEIDDIAIAAPLTKYSAGVTDGDGAARRLRDGRAPALGSLRASRRAGADTRGRGRAVRGGDHHRPRRSRSNDTS